MRKARHLSRRSGETEHVYAETHYAAGTWSRCRRVIIKAEVVREPGKDPKDRPRFVITNQTQSPRWIYERVYCQRGDVENRIKELHDGLQIDRTSCTDFWANQFRVLLTAAVFVLMQELRLRTARTACARSGLDPAGAAAEARRAGASLGAPGRRSSARLLPVSYQFPPHRARSR